MKNNLTFQIALHLDASVDPVCKVIDRSAESILDVGSGPGYPMKMIRTFMRPKRVVGVDLFKKYIDETKAERVHDEYVICDVRKMKFRANSFDVVLCSHVIEHLPKEDGVKFVADLERIAKKQVIIATPIGEMYHPPVDGNKLQLHKSHYYPKDFSRKGYKVVKYGRKFLTGENGIVHKVDYDPIKKSIFIFNILISPLFYKFQWLADYTFVAVKDVTKNKEKNKRRQGTKKS